MSNVDEINMGLMLDCNIEYFAITDSKKEIFSIDNHYTDNFEVIKTKHLKTIKKINLAVSTNNIFKSRELAKRMKLDFEKYYILKAMECIGIDYYEEDILLFNGFDFSSIEFNIKTVINYNEE